MPLRVSPAQIACLDFNLQKTKVQMGVQVLLTDPRELERIHQREADMTKERIQKHLSAGANIVLTSKGIDDMALKYFVEAGAIAVRRVREEDLSHVAKATGATMVSTFADMEGEETFEPSFIGHADEVVEERIADDYVIMDYVILEHLVHSNPFLDSFGLIYVLLKFMNCEWCFRK